MQQLDLKARTDVEGLEVTPRPIVTQMLFLLLAVGLLEALDDFRDVLCAVLVGDEQSVGRIDNDEVLKTDGRHDRLFGVDIASRRILQHRFAVDIVPFVVARRDFPKPRAASRIWGSSRAISSR